MTTLQCVASVLLHGASVAEAASQPLAHGVDALGSRPTNTLTEVASTSKSAIADTEDAESTEATEVTLDLPGLYSPHALTGMYYYRLGATPMSPSVDGIASAFDSVAQVVEDGFPADVLEGARRRGVKLDVRPLEEPTIPRGYWVGLACDESTGFEGARTAFSAGIIEGY